MSEYTHFTGVDAENLYIDGTEVTASAAELNILDGVTASAAELNILDGVTASAAELNILDGVTATKDELNVLDGYRHDAYHLSNAVQVKAIRYTLDQLNAGQIIIDPGAAGQWQVLDVKIRAIGGAIETCTSIDLVEETSGNIVFSAPVAGLTENAWVTVTTENVVSTYLSVWSTIGKDLLLDVVGDPAATATHVDVVITYVH
jgi:hypothetical protein